VFDNIREDWHTHNRQWNRHGFWLLAIYRLGRWRYTISSRILRLPFSILYKLLGFAAVPLLGAELPCEAIIGRRLVIEHTGIPGSPQLGDRVDIGAGAKLLGPITIGNDAAIGANAVVLTDVPPGAIAVGIPARIIPRKADPAE
jgi:serine O-acetyltransferase